jgi:2-polyprenyl-3-methyl-5-hydroxy-6-metoxy-1,4-benzoquinol methylase
MKSVFVELGPDEALVSYLVRALTTRASVGRTRLQRALRLLMSDFDANALLRVYPMHLLSTTQAEVLLGRTRRGRLLDIGAGSGDVTRALQPLFAEVEVTETSRVAARRLRESGFACQTYDVAAQGVRGGPFDTIALLNVLDRTDKPLTLLQQCRKAMTDATVLLLSTPLPYRPHVYVGSSVREPTERLALVGNEFSDAIMRLTRDVLLLAGLTPLRLTRVPYLSGGDSASALTVLSAAVAVCRPTVSVSQGA